MATTKVHPERIRNGSRSDAADPITAYLRGQVDQLHATDMAVRLREPDGIHDMRVTVRRLRGTLRTFRKVLGRHDALGAELKWLSGVLGTARDAEVLHRQLTKQIDATPSELVLGPVRAQLERQLSRPTADAGAAVLTALESGRYLALLDTVDRLVDTGRPIPERALPKLVGKAYRKAERAMRAAERATDRDAALHEVRKAARRLRYACEAVAPVVGKPARRTRKRAKRVQDVLGRHHDLVSLRAPLRDAGVQAHLDGANGFTFGLLHGRAVELARQAEAEFPPAWRRLARPKATRWMRR